jgi:nicotinamidase-related amidase
MNCLIKSLASNAALLLIDMQQGIHDPKLGRRNNPRAETNMALLLQAWRDSARPLVHVRHMSRSPESVFWPGSSGVEFQAAFMPWPDEHVVEKNVPDAFIGTGLESWLHVRGIRQLVLAGVATHNSVEGSARSGGNLGFDTVVVADATFTFDQRDFNGRVWPAEEVHALSLSTIAADYARIENTAGLLQQLQTAT